MPVSSQFRLKPGTKSADESCSRITLQHGHPFNPYRIFNGLFIPEGLARSRAISAGAKLAWGRLARYAGQDGRCHPTMKTLGDEIGVGTRQAQKYVAELQDARLIRRQTRFLDKGQTSNSFQFLWHSIFEEGVNDRSGEGVNDRSPKESQFEESHNRDLDCPPTNRKKRDSQPGVTSSACKQYPQLREALADYMMSGPDDIRVIPKDRHVVDIVDAAGGATEKEILICFGYLRNERGLRPGTKNGPRHFSWFATVVGDYFRQKREREEAADPIGHTAWAGRNESRGIESP